MSGLPKPFSQAPRLTIYRRELYDYAECINLAVLLEGRFPALDERLGSTVSDLLQHWQKNDGSFRSRKLLLGMGQRSHASLGAGAALPQSVLPARENAQCPGVLLMHRCCKSQTPLNTMADQPRVFRLQEIAAP